MIIIDSIINIINSYCEKNHISIRSLEEKSNIGNGTIRGWKKSKPSLKSLSKISEVTGISLNKLVEGCLVEDKKAG